MAIITYIDKNGNFAQLDNVLDKNRMSKVEKIGNGYFEKRDIIEKPAKIKKVEEKVEKKVEEKEEISEELIAKAKEILKANKVKGYGLLKWEKLIEKAKEYGL